MNLFYQPAILQGVLQLDIDELRHAIKVLRMRAGDTLHLTDGQGSFYEGVITEADSKACRFSIIETRKIPARNFSISIAIAPTKNIDRTEWFVEKAVELGVEHIHFMQCKNSERKTINLDRIQKIMVSAMKQSGQAWLPGYSEMKPFQEILKLTAIQKFICFVDSQNPDQLKLLAQPNQSYLALIGPEGDFQKEELDLAMAANFKKVTLGNNRLRTETAGVAACHTLNLINL